MHAVDVVGMKAGMDEPLLMLLASSPVPVTYAGGVIFLDDLNLARALGNDMVDVTVDSALELRILAVCSSVAATTPTTPLSV